MPGCDLGERDELVERLRRHVGMDHQDGRQRDQRGDRREILDRVVAEVGVERGIDRHRAGIAEHQHVAVGRGLRHQVGGDDAARAGHVLDHERLAEGGWRTCRPEAAPARRDCRRGPPPRPAAPGGSARHRPARSRRTTGRAPARTRRQWKSSCSWNSPYTCPAVIPGRSRHQRVHARLRRAMERARNPEKEAVPILPDSGFATSWRPGMTAESSRNLTPRPRCLSPAPPPASTSAPAPPA